MIKTTWNTRGKDFQLNGAVCIPFKIKELVIVNESFDIRNN